MDKINWSLIFERPNHRERGEEEKREEEEEKKKRSQEKRYGFYDFWYGYYMESKDLMVLYGILGNFMISKPRV